MAKPLAKSAVRKLLNQLPERAKNLILNILVEARGIVGFLAIGEYGTIQGNVNDLMILSSYSIKGTWATTLNSLFVDFFKTGKHGTYIDIGANIGLTTIPVAQNANVTCYAFEPEPGNFSHLVENVRRNCPHENVNLRQVAVGDTLGNVTIAINPFGNCGDNRVIRQTSERGWSTVEVPSVRLDDLFHNVDGPLVVKIDVQGFEPFVLAGGLATLSKANLVVLEFSPYLIKRSGGDPTKLIDFVAKYDSIALIKGESDEAPIFESPDAACVRLSAFAKTMAENTQEYLDVIARRST